MKSAAVEICCGTTCYMLGAAELMKLEDILESPLKEQTGITLVPCMGLCTSENLEGAPFVRVNGKIISRASVEDVLAELREVLDA